MKKQKELALLARRSVSAGGSLSKGFTLIEMIVVIGIIGILTTMILISVSRIRKNSIDTRRKSNLENVRGAITMYYAGKSAWPCPSSGSACPACPVSGDSSNWCLLVTELSTAGYLTDNILADEDGETGDEYSVTTCAAGAGCQLKLCANTLVTNADDQGCDGTKCCLDVK